VEQEKYRPILGDAFDLVQRLLCYDPTQRLSARQALSNIYFTNDPVTDWHGLPKLTADHVSFHELETKRARKEKKVRHAMHCNARPGMCLLKHDHDG
jgi:serine/threonine protein kinase